MPGPGKYDASVEKNKGEYVISNLRSTAANVFPKKEREFFKALNNNPGPG